MSKKDEQKFETVKKIHNKFLLRHFPQRKHILILISIEVWQFVTRGLCEFSFSC